MNLFILRHAIAAELGGPERYKDPDRPLTPEGKRKLARVLDALKRLDLSFELIVSSPYVRARETAELLHKRFKHAAFELNDALVPGGSRRRLIEFLAGWKPAPENVVLVGHEPDLSELVSFLICGEPRSVITLKKAGICKLSVHHLSNGRCAVLEWLLTPAQMRLMA